MKNKRSRLALFGVLALALSVTVGLTAGVAEAQKKKKRKGAKGGQVTVTSNATHTVAAAIPIAPGEEVAGQTIVTLPTPNKKAKGKVVSPDSVTATYAISGVPSTPPTGGPGFVGINLQHRGRETGLPTPFDTGTTLIGKVTASPNSNVGFCTPDAAPPPPPCSDPANSCLRPYACTVQANQLTIFGLQKAKGAWIFRLLNFGSTNVTVNQLSVTATLKIVPGLE
jgi:hypothetical protein